MHHIYDPLVAASDQKPFLKFSVNAILAKSEEVEEDDEDEETEHPDKKDDTRELSRSQSSNDPFLTC